MKENILGYQVDSLPIASCVDDVFAHIAQGQGRRWFACLNPHSYAVALNDAPFAQALRAADWLVPDGVGVVHASRWLGGSIRERVTGSDVFFGLHEQMNATGGMSVFFLGATEETLANIRARMAQEYPNIRLAGTISPPFKASYSDVEIKAMLSAINAAKTDVLWVGMTAPKQEKWIAENLSKLDVRFAGAIGAVFDFYTGKVHRSHPVFQKLGLEWLPRLLQQPRRLWRRMFISAPVFVGHVIKQRIQQGKC
ncbi:MAG: WecB/TagA/CpsF family glycosyltransferase [Hydrogenophaga sp.]|nr:WecB/TagA/CpsF family glycosyltransferase [Hydrogenophaga sp.]